MGSVYRALDTELDETVALKVLRRELVDKPGILDRFRREAKLARALPHKNVARVFDIGSTSSTRSIQLSQSLEPGLSGASRTGAGPADDLAEGEGEKFLTMEFIDGESLAARLARGPLMLANAVEIASAICAGLGRPTPPASSIAI